VTRFEPFNLCPGYTPLQQPSLPTIARQAYADEHSAVGEESLPVSSRPLLEQTAHLTRRQAKASGHAWHVEEVGSE
jgi:hypothetical protein